MSRRSKLWLHILLPASIAILGVRLVLTLAQSAEFVQFTLCGSAR